MRKILIFSFAFFAVLSFWACDSSDERNATIEVWLTDAPGDYEAVNVDVQGVEIHAVEGEQTAGWKSVPISKGVYDLLDLRNGEDTLLGRMELPAGRISQIRFKLGNNNTIKIEGQTANLNLTAPSGQQSGLKLQVHEVLTEGIVYKIVLDFDAALSVVKTGNGSYKLKPVIRTITEATSGAIKGVVDPATSTPAVYAIDIAAEPDDTVSTAYADATSGAFLLRGVPPGNYRVTFEPQTGYKATLKEGVAVTLGNVNDVGSVSIEEQ